jgi:hypothetical protein
MPDLWEKAKGLDPTNAADGADIHQSGYSNVERYLNGEPARGKVSCQGSGLGSARFRGPPG